LFSLGISKTVIWKRYHADDYNYYCLPFQLMKIETPVIVGLQTAVIVLNLLLIASYVMIQVLLFRFIQNHVEQTRETFKSRIQKRKIAIRMSCLITSNIVTWVPVLITQLVIMYADDITPSTFLMVIFASLPANLLIDPAVLFLPFLINIREKLRGVN